MIDSFYRQTYQTICIVPLLPLLKRFHPNGVTLTGCLIGLLVCPLLAFHFNWFAFLVLLMSGFLDTIDGTLARYLKQTSPTGAALDIVCDRGVEFAVVLGLFFVEPGARAFPCLFMLGSILLCVTTFLVVGIFTENQTNKSFFYSPGLIERAEAFLFFSVMILFPSIFFFASYLFSILTFFTAFIRIWQFCKHCKNINYGSRTV